MGNHVQHFVCVLSYERNYFCVLWIPHCFIHSEMVVCFSNFYVQYSATNFDLIWCCSYSSSYLNLRKWENIAQQTLGCNHKQWSWVHFRKQWTTFGSTNLGFAWFNDSCSKLLPRMIVTFFRCYLRQSLKLIKLIFSSTCTKKCNWLYVFSIMKS